MERGEASCQLGSGTSGPARVPLATKGQSRAVMMPMPIGRGCGCRRAFHSPPRLDAATSFGAQRKIRASNSLRKRPRHKTSRSARAFRPDDRRQGGPLDHQTVARPRRKAGARRFPQSAAASRKMRMIFVQEFVIEARMQNLLHPRFDFADVDQHAVGGIDLAGENKVGDVVPSGAVAGRRSPGQRRRGFPHPTRMARKGGARRRIPGAC